MKKIFATLMMSAFVAFAAVAQEPAAPAAPAAATGPAIQFEEQVHDFGELVLNANAVTDFKFVNIGVAPLILSEAKSTCGCTVPSFSRTPIAPGDTGVVTVKYRYTDRKGGFNKSVTIHSNAENSPVVTLTIKGAVN